MKTNELLTNSTYRVLKSYYFIQRNKTLDHVNDNLILQTKIMFIPST
jgi:hypothetical protein